MAKGPWGWLAALLTVVLVGCGDEPEAPPPMADPDSVRQIEQGELIGLRAGDAHVWRGIPYAAPPVGDRRWRAPRPVAGWSGAREALAFGNPCMQIGTPLGGAPEEVTGELWGNEDCLFLNVYTPAVPAAAVPGGDERWPVMVWIHGGGNTVGHSGFYNGAPLAASQNVVVVTLNYRLGPLGWFLHPALAHGGDDFRDASGNYGTLDLIHALGWVRENIAAFGGDPQRVTLFGESAGGTNIFSLLVSPLARDLFHGAIVQSGSTGSSSAANASHYQDNAEAPGAPFSSREVALRSLVDADCERDCARDRIEAMSAATQARHLRELSPKALFGLYEGGEAVLGPPSPTVIRDGQVLPERQFLDVLEDPAAFARVPVILGTNRDEPKIFMVFSEEHVVRVAGIPLWRRDAERYELEAEYGALAWQLRGVTEPAQRLHAADVPVWAYRWDWDEQGRRFGINLSALLGAAHGLEIPFVFGHWDIGRLSQLIFNDDNRAEREALSARMMAYWAAFARKFDPGQGTHGNVPRWQRWQPDGLSYTILDTEADGGIRMSREHLRLADLVERLAIDERLDSAEARCEVFRSSFRFSIDERLQVAATRLGCD